MSLHPSRAGAVVCKSLSSKWPLNVPLWSRAALKFVLSLTCSAGELLEGEGCWLVAYVYPPLYLCTDSAFFQASRIALPSREFTCPLVLRGFPLLSLALRAQKFPGKVRTQAARNQSLQCGKRHGIVSLQEPRQHYPSVPDTCDGTLPYSQHTQGRDRSLKIWGQPGHRVKARPTRAI